MFAIKLILSSLTCALLAVAAVACGEAHSGGKPASARSAPIAARVALPEIETKGDPDDDSDRYPKEQPDRDEVPDFKTEPFGHPADAAETDAAAAVVKRYYADAVREDGSAACRLLYAPRTETIAAEFGGSTGSTSKHKATCGSGLSRLFRQLHGLLRSESRGLGVSALRVELNKGSVQLRLAHISTPHFTEVHRERGVWKLDMLVDINHPVIVE